MSVRGKLRCALAGAVLAGLLSSGHAAFAEPTPGELHAARELFGKAEKDEEAGHWADALEKLRRAATVKMTPGIRFHIGLCEEKLGQLVAALNDYSGAETQARAEANKDVLDAVAEPVAALRARVPTLTVTVPADVKNAQVNLDGAALPTGLWGTPVPLDAGSHAVQATAAGRADFSTTVVLAEREGKTVEVKLPLPVTRSPAPSVASSGAPDRATALATPPPPAEPDERHHGPRGAAVVATVAAIVLVGGGVASYMIADGKQSDAQTECLKQASCDDLKGPIRTFDWLALGAWVAGAGVGAVAIVLWATPAPIAPGAAPAESRAALVVGPGTVGLRGTF